MDKFNKHIIIIIVPLILLGLIWPDSLHASSRGLKKVKTSAGKTVELCKDSYALVIGNSNYNNGWDPLPGVKR